MPQFLVAIHHPDTFDPSTVTEETMRDIGALNKDMMAAGVRLFAGGLQPETKAKSLMWTRHSHGAARLSSPAGRRSRYARFLRWPPQNEQSTHSSRLRCPQRRLRSGFGTRARSDAGGG